MTTSKDLLAAGAVWMAMQKGGLKPEPLADPDYNDLGASASVTLPFGGRSRYRITVEEIPGDAATDHD